MCIAIYKPKDVDISEDVLRKSYKNNPDGAGYMFTENGKIIIKKGYFKFKTFYKNYIKDLNLNVNSNFVIHFRIKTHGKINKKNCHPHRVNQSIALAHNGQIHDVDAKGSESDTIVFIEEYLKTLPDGWEFSGAINALVAEFIGKSKLVFLHANGSSWILNSQMGEWRKGAWYSNDSYRIDRVKYMKPPKYTNSVFTDAEYRNAPVCVICGKNKLLYESTIERGYCHECGDAYVREFNRVKHINKTDEPRCVAFGCGKTLITETEKNIGICSTCYKKYEDQWMGLTEKDEVNKTYMLPATVGSA